MVDYETLRSPIKFCSVKLSEVIANSMRLDAHSYNIEAKQARDIVEYGKYQSVSLNDLIKQAYYPGRFKRIYCSPKKGYPFYLPSQMNDVYPKTDKYISYLTNCNIDELKLKNKTLLLTRSGTIGTISLVSQTTEEKIFSDDVIRITFKNNDDLGYVYTYLKNKIGNKILVTNAYGAVINHIEPEHLKKIPIPDAPSQIKKHINDLVVKSYDLRDEANLLVDEATTMLMEELHFPNIYEFEDVVYNKNTVNTFNVKLSNLEERLDASYHIPIISAIIEHMKKYADEVTTVGDKRVSKKIILPGRFKRFYVEEGKGKIFIGGKQLGELNPANKKYLSLTHHADRINKQLTLHEGMTLITCSGTIGKVALVGKHWENWTASQHIIRIIPTNKDIAGYLSIFLASDYGHQLITRYTYGSVVNEIDDTHVSNIPFPILKNKNIQRQINNIALEANEKKYEAYKKEQEALRIMEEEVLVQDRRSN